MNECYLIVVTLVYQDNATQALTISSTSDLQPFLYTVEFVLHVAWRADRLLLRHGHQQQEREHGEEEDVATSPRCHQEQGGQADTHLEMSRSHWMLHCRARAVSTQWGTWRQWPWNIISTFQRDISIPQSQTRHFDQHITLHHPRPQPDMFNPKVGEQTCGIIQKLVVWNQAQIEYGVASQDTAKNVKEKHILEIETIESIIYNFSEKIKSFA